MSEVRGSNTSSQMITIYVRLLDEGTAVYRPVPALAQDASTCVLCGTDIYNPAVENWEFLPGTRVGYEKRVLDGEAVFVAVRR